MKFILDTHILLAVVGLRLHSQSPKIAKLLTHSDNQLYASVASLWEIAIKTRLGKLNPGMSLGLLPPALQAFGIGIVPITRAHALVSVVPLPPTKDPFDRMLLVQCQIEGCLLVTVDGALRNHPLTAQI
ncbi:MULTISPECIES: type II toxin-antitoxin system VapC family toxin [unclassified Methylobacterium]|jgi:PIN domain nuclease of toxin-antitoxin system|uniref:type II toxin-antitoxin system VapC family toxin n=1 Tax=unclassified Methylobacterium TaxID=2615210 RepID=UPI00135516F8|nr:type II toxin-antitoxin system VapC family toxin [Methylobacterium sp. 2A]MWV21991.1 type II toxin-antitoxin system VapC family toxin [Methylobacterium sp. 2A]